MQEKTPGRLTLRTLAMPADTNPSGDVFGGWVMSQMDIAAGISATQRCNGRAVTIAVDGMVFLRPVKVGDVLGVYTEVKSVGRTSMIIRVEAWARRALTSVREKVTEADFKFVALDEDGLPTPVPEEGMDLDDGAHF